MSEIVETIAEVETKTLPTGTVIYVIKDSQGREYSTKDREIAKEAYGLVGNQQAAHIDFTEKKGGQFGQFTNRFVNTFATVPENQAYEAAGGGFRLPGEQGGPPADPGPPPGLFEDTAPAAETAIVGRDRDSERELAINKSVALKEGVRMLAYLSEDERSPSAVIAAADYFMREWLVKEWTP